MFDNIKLGQYIQFLRKSAGLTQGRLAETLGVSHQAVSNWERGESMPDIALLSLLARALGSTVDRMLAAAEDYDPKIYQALSQTEGEPQAPVKAEPVKAGEPAEMGPASKEADSAASERSTESQPGPAGVIDLNETLRNVRVTIKDAISRAVTGLEGIRGVRAIFSNMEDEIDGAMDDAEDELEEIEEDIGDARKKRLEVEIHMDKAGESDGWAKITSMAPFASEEALDRLVDRLDVSGETMKLAAVAPFLSEKTLSRLASKIINGGDPKGWDTLVSIAPFMHTSTLDELVVNRESSIPDKYVKRLLPFLSSRAVDELLSR